jgi:hypothetical protein
MQKRWFLGFTILAVLISFAAVHVLQQFKLIPEQKDYIVLAPSDVADVYGGSMPSSGGKVNSPAPNPNININLDNVPYVNQYTSDARSRDYCGIASVMMARLKDKVNAKTAPYYSERIIRQDLERIDSFLQVGFYGGGIPVDVQKNRGLLYISNESRVTQFVKTETVLKAIYKAKGSDGISDSGPCIRNKY